jgi:Tol biopolymer transport system component
VSFALSPDGKRVAWFKPSVSGEVVELWVAMVAGGSPTRILPASIVRDESYSSPLWSPGGDRIAFGTYVADPATGERHRTAISVVAPDGSGLHRLTTRAGVLDDAMSWSADGRFLAYLGVPDARDVHSIPPTASGGPQGGSPPGDVFVIGADGSGDRNVTNTPASEHGPAWSPDGAVLAFDTSADGEAHRLTTVRMNGPTPVGPPVLGPASEWFVWSPDGSELLWLEVTSLGTEAYRSTIHSTDPEFRQPPTTLQAVDGLIVCPPSWQRLEP